MMRALLMQCERWLRIFLSNGIEDEDLMTLYSKNCEDREDTFWFIHIYVAKTAKLDIIYDDAGTFDAVWTVVKDIFE